ncbi:MAG: hypothetical protein JNN07_10350 [Verrucomicrobiales bacterium]|nr:hypothetical protein [Verrucomicrobiales bacterium]
MTTIRTFVLALTTLALLSKPAEATVRYIDICGVLTMNQIPTSGLLVEAVRCSDNVVLVSQLTQPGIIFNYHLRYEDEDDGLPGGEFQGNLTPIPVFMRVSYPGCPTPLIFSCDEIAAGYEATIDGKLTLYKNLDCATPLPLIGDFVFLDRNDNGLQEDNEPGVPGVTVRLSYPTPGGGTTVIATNTDAAGRYSFTPPISNTDVLVQVDTSTFPPGKGPGKCDGTFDVLYTGTKPITTVDFCLVNAPVIDTDTDGLPDDWETRYGLNPNSAADAGIDSDSDGMGNLDEFEAATDPKNPQSRLALSSVEIVGADVRLRFQAQRWKAYQVERLNEAKAQIEWVAVGIAVTTPGESGEVFVDDIFGANRTIRLYRLRVLP